MINYFKYIDINILSELSLMLFPHFDVITQGAEVRFYDIRLKLTCQTYLPACITISSLSK